jgi:hypothetical protein
MMGFLERPSRAIIELDTQYYNFQNITKNAPVELSKEIGNLYLLKIII